MGRWPRANGGSLNRVELPYKRKEQASDVNKFFKMMFGKGHTEVMYLPPKFAQTVTALIGQKISILNLNNQHWDVTISLNDGLMVFKEGWPKFFQENNLGIGDLLVFEYSSGNHFKVDIFLRKNACQKTDFTTKGRTQTNKRSKKIPEIIPVQTTNVSNIEDELCSFSALKRGSKPQNIPKTLMTPPNAHVINLEDDTICMVNRDVDFSQGESRNITFDLLSFELKNRKSDGENIRTTAPVPLVHVEQRETNGKDNQPASSHLSDKVEDCDDFFPYTAHNNPFDDANSNNAMPDDVYKPNTGGVTGFLPSSYVSPSTSSTSNVAKRENAFMVNLFDEYSLRSSFPIPDTAKEAVYVKKELMESREKFGGFAHMLSRGSEGFMPTDTVHPSLGSTSQITKRDSAFTSEGFDISTRSSFPFPNFGANKGVFPSYSPSIGITGHDVKPDNAFMPKAFDSSLPSSSSFPNSSVDQVVRIKKELDSRETRLGFGQVSHGRFPNMTMNFGQTSLPIVKTEPGLSNYDAVPSVAPSSFSVKVKSQSYLDLPVCISLSNSGERKVVTLRDTTGRLWPVIYTDLYVTKAFTGNWKSFCEANEVEPGDTCEFQPENNSFYDFGVIVHKSRSTS